MAIHSERIRSATPDQVMDDVSGTWLARPAAAAEEPLPLAAAVMSQMTALNALLRSSMNLARPASVGSSMLFISGIGT